MQGDLGKAFLLLAKELAPYVDQRLRTELGDQWYLRNTQSGLVLAENSGEWDAHIVLVLMWDHWNQVFRHSLTFSERSLISELREYRNRWAHQQHISERDTYRCLDGIDRLLDAVVGKSPKALSELRRESLHRLHDDELLESRKTQKDWFTAITSVVCSGLLVTAILQHFHGPSAWILSAMVVVVFGRLVYRLMKPKKIIATGPRQCSGCGKVFYGQSCPYCERTETVRTPGLVSAAEVSQRV